MIEFFVFIGKSEAFFSIIDCWKIRSVLQHCPLVGKNRYYTEHLRWLPLILYSEYLLCLSSFHQERRVYGEKCVFEVSLYVLYLLLCIPYFLE